MTVTYTAPATPTWCYVLMACVCALCLALIFISIRDYLAKYIGHKEAQ